MMPASRSEVVTFDLEVDVPAFDGRPAAVDVVEGGVDRADGEECEVEREKKAQGEPDGLAEAGQWNLQNLLI